MNRVKIVIEAYDEYADPDHDTGLTEEGHMALMDVVGNLPGDLVEVVRTGDQ